MQNIKLHLAPMEGVMDYYTRDILTTIGGIDHCVSEFIRVNEISNPTKVFLREVPELQNQSRTKAGTNIFVQLLGGNPDRMADDAQTAVNLGACGIDLNFGCPAKTVNRNDGGATLLLHPQRIENIVSSVRKALPNHIPVTAKIRLGFTDPNTCFDNARAVENGGAQWLTVHCRTKTQMYHAPAEWEWIPKIKEKVKLPIVVNGDIFSVNDLEKCKRITGCSEFMLGRGVFRDPFLFRKIKYFDNGGTWSQLRGMLFNFFNTLSAEVSPYFAQARTKQWLREIAKGEFLEAKILFENIKVITDPTEFHKLLESSLENPV